MRKTLVVALMAFQMLMIARRIGLLGSRTMRRLLGLMGPRSDVIDHDHDHGDGDEMEVVILGRAHRCVMIHVTDTKQ
jgi:hypothetical protein